VEEQRDLKTNPWTRPDFLITRQDEPAPEIAVYVDGYQYHAASGSAGPRPDAQKRRGVRSSGRLVWSLTWDDIAAFHEAVDGPLLKVPAQRPLLPSRGRQVAQQAHHGLPHGALEVNVADLNPMLQLLSFLARPDVNDWEGLALSVIAGLAAMGASKPLDRPDVLEVVRAALFGEKPPDTAAGDLRAARWASNHGLSLTAILDARAEVGGQAAERWTVVAALDDREAASGADDHKARWHDWLQWSNVLQFLRGDREACVCTVTEADELDANDFSVVPPPSGPVRAEPLSVAAAAEVGMAALSPDASEELELIVDDDVRDLVERVLHRGAPTPVAGYEEDGWVVEVAWPDRKVAITYQLEPEAVAWLDEHGWTARAAEDWDEDELLEATRGEA
jgi:hypothetical protein